MTGEKNSPTVALACRTRRLKSVPGARIYKWATLSLGVINTATKGVNTNRKSEVLQHIGVGHWVSTIGPGNYFISLEIRNMMPRT